MESKDWNSIVPQPQSLELKRGSLAVAKLCLVVAGPFAAEARLMAQRHPQLRQVTVATSAATMMQLREVSGLGAEGYRLSIAKKGVCIAASTSAGAFYGTITLSQWLWQYSSLPVARVHDYPRFGWRGYMLDVSRHFFPFSYIKELMYQLASYKINRLHLHLSDDQGWRLPIDSYPRLTEFGSGRYWSFENFYDKKPGAQEFYSKEQIGELNKLAAQLHILLVPEIDLPGHATAAIACYPQLLCEPFQNQDLKIMPLWGISRNVLCLGKRQVWDFIYAVLDELTQLFPGPYIHLGGDEVPHQHWQSCPACQSVLRREKLKNCNDLQNLFTRRSRDYIVAKGKLPLYWDEVEESGLSDGTVCCFWRSWMDEAWDVRAALKGVPVISCPVAGAYLDYKHRSDPHEAGNIGCTTVYDSYNFIPLADKQPELARYNLGIQANLWTECLNSPRHVEYMAYPRLLALAEQAWHKGGWPLFQKKWPPQKAVLKAQGINNYYRGPWQD